MAINLLPWREQNYLRNRNNFLLGLVFAMFFTYGFCFAYYGVINNKIQQQQLEIKNIEDKNKLRSLNAENNFLMAEKLKLENLKLAAISTLRLPQQKLVRVLQALLQAIPRGAKLTELSFEQNNLVLAGECLSWQTLMVFKNNLENMHIATLIELKNYEESQGKLTFVIAINL